MQTQCILSLPVFKISQPFRNKFKMEIPYSAHIRKFLIIKFVSNPTAGFKLEPEIVRIFSTITHSDMKVQRLFLIVRSILASIIFTIIFLFLSPQAEPRISIRFVHQSKFSFHRYFDNHILTRMFAHNESNRKLGNRKF